MRNSYQGLCVSPGFPLRNAEALRFRTERLSCFVTDRIVFTFPIAHAPEKKKTLNPPAILPIHSDETRRTVDIY